MSNILDLVQMHELRRFAPGEIVLEEGTKTEELLFLAEGAVEIVKDGVQVTTASQPGAVFGEISALLGCSHTATVRALQPCTFYVTGSPRKFVEGSPPIWRHVSESLAQRLDAVNTFLVKAKQKYEGRDHIEILNGVLEALMQRDPPRLIRVPSSSDQAKQFHS
jgi:CRP/FNR family cyclic AMP-dependent transcriptional regulator